MLGNGTPGYSLEYELGGTLLGVSSALYLFGCHRLTLELL
jgi:hypothetical protein